MSEIIFLAILALVIVGPKELPQLARTLGRFLNELKRSSNILTDEIKQQTRLDRFDLDSAMSRRDQVRAEEENHSQTQGPPDQADYHHAHHGHHGHQPHEPQQMDLSEQMSDEENKESTDDSGENKKS